MASGFTVSGRGDLDSLFMARVNAKRADVGYRVAGADVSNRYEPIGAGTPIAATGYRSAGTDLANLFRNINQSLATLTLPSSVEVQVADSLVEYASFIIGSDGILRRDSSTFGPGVIQAWINPTSSAPGMQMRWTSPYLVGGSMVAPPANTWLAMSSTYTFRLNRGPAIYAEMGGIIEFTGMGLSGSFPFSIITNATP